MSCTSHTDSSNEPAKKRPKLSQTKRIFYRLVDATGELFPNFPECCSVLIEDKQRSPAVIEDVDDLKDVIWKQNEPALFGFFVNCLWIFSDEYAFRNADGTHDPKIDSLYNTRDNPFWVVVSKTQPGDVFQDQKLWGATTDEMNGILPTLPHVDRSEQLTYLKALLETNEFVLISSPSASGKTSLVRLYGASVADTVNVIYIGCSKSVSLRDQLFHKCGVDLINLIFSRRNKKPTVIIVDDAQVCYEESDTWTSLLKSMPQVLKSANCKVIFVAAHSLKIGRKAIPDGFSALPKLDRTNLLLNEEESFKLLSNSDYGLKGNLASFDELKKVISRQCGGLIGALAIVRRDLNNYFRFKVETETDALNRFLSKPVTDLMERCYGPNHSTPNYDNKYLEILRMYFGESGGIVDLKDQYVLDLIESGIFTISEVTGNAVFASTMAERYFFQYMFGNRSSTDPVSLPSLIEDCVSHFSPTLLTNSTLEDDFPKEAVFQHLFLELLARFTPVAISIYPELSRSFDNYQKIPGEVDFYIDKNKRWAIELMAQGRGIKEHMSRFGPNGKYAKLNPNDYVLVDFRTSTNGKPTSITRHEKKITVFFQPGDFSECWFVRGMEEPRLLKLSDRKANSK